MTSGIVSPAKALRTLRKTDALLRAQLAKWTQAEASALRDGPDGWSVLLIVCHLRDFEAVWRQRVELILAEIHPIFPEFDYQAAVSAHHYADQDYAAVCADLAAQRATLIERLAALDEALWRRTGVLPSQGPGTLLDVAVNAGLHDLDHLEQLTRCNP